MIIMPMSPQPESIQILIYMHKKQEISSKPLWWVYIFLIYIVYA